MKINKITTWDLPDTLQIPDGYDYKTVPDLTRRNFNYLIKRHNDLVNVINVLHEKLGIENE